MRRTSLLAAIAAVIGDSRGFHSVTPYGYGFNFFSGPPDPILELVKLRSKHQHMDFKLNSTQTRRKALQRHYDVKKKKQLPLKAKGLRP